MKDLILVKIGGSLITDKSKPFTERKDVIRRLAGEIHEARVEKGIKLLVGHGGGSYPHKPAKEYSTHKGISGKEGYKGMALVQDAAARLHRIVVGELIEAGENAMSVQPSAASLSNDGRIVEWYTKPIEKLLDYGMLPVVYGDVGIDTKKGCCILSTEELFRFLSTRLRPKRVIMCGKTDGVFTSDPGKDSSAKHIPEITLKSFPEMRKHLLDSDGIDVTGGMIHKIEQALELVRNGASVQVINGKRDGDLKKALLGENVKGTVIR
ncbi:MAG: isopentenyl phosphate kinase family protein [Candidatus Aenigmatarchaeota archaeon]|nr:MAG: isopentenyl phosphate kinase family protein [Candidatus Aenigmarchaeota archaeon]